VEVEVADFMTQLESFHVLGLDDLNYRTHEVVADGEEVAVEKGEVEVADEEEVGEENAQASVKRSSTENYGTQEKISLCHAWMDVLRLMQRLARIN
jgi:hypothetical protein